MKTRARTKQTLSQGEGVDGLNLVEWPLSVLATKAAKGQKTLEFEETVIRKGERVHQRVIITGSDKYGLPNANHHKVLVGLIQLWQRKSRCQDARVEFSRYELLDVLNWPDDGYYYKLAKNALSIWKGTNLYFENAWWVNGRWKTKGFGIIDDFELCGRKGRRNSSEKQDDVSYVVWGSVVHKEFLAERTKGLDFDLFLRLKSPVAQQLYRHLDKWFWYSPYFKHGNLRGFACEKIGASRNYSNSELMRLLDKGFDELTSEGYIKGADRKQRYPKQGKGYGVRVEASTGTLASKTENDEQKADPLLKDLLQRGVTKKAALAAIADKTKSQSRIEEDIEHVDFLDDTGQIKASKGGLLTKMILAETAWERPKGFQSRADKKAGEEKRKRERKDKQERAKAEAKRLAKEELVHAKERAEFQRFIAAYSEEELDALELNAIGLAEKAGERFVAQMVQKARKREEPLTNAGRLRLQFWKEYVFPQVAAWSA